MDMRMYKRGNIWQVEYARNKSISLRTSDEAVAQKLFDDMVYEQTRGKLLLLDKRKRLSISELSNLYLNDPDRINLSPKTHEADELALRQLRNVIGDIPIKLVTKDSIKEFKKMSLTRVKAVSVNTYLRHIKAALKWAEDEGYIKKAPAAKQYKIEGAKPRPIPREDVKRILEYSKKHSPEMYRIIIFALFTGCRRAEIVRARYEHIEGTFITVVGKGNKERTFELLPQALPTRKDIGKIFSYSHTSTLSNYFRKIVRALEIPVRFHDLRHTAGTMMLAEGVDLAVVQKILGHADIRTTQIYADILLEQIHKQMGKLKDVTFE